MELLLFDYQIGEVQEFLRTPLSADERLAASLQLNLLLKEKMVIQDFEMCNNMQRAILNNATQEALDEDMARRMSGYPARDHTQFRELLGRLNSDFENRCRVHDNDDTYRSESADEPVDEPQEHLEVSGLKGAAVELRECAVCRTHKATVYDFPCGHSHCRSCTRRIFQLALEDRSLLPIRCCRQEIDQTLSAEVLDAEAYGKFNAALEEATARTKMYCPSKECGIFINLDKTGTGPKLFFQCPGCALPLCKECRAAHPSLTCEQYVALGKGKVSTEDAAFLRLAADQKYARCNHCRSFVELKQGCNHMTCICRYEFCYQCNAQWKTCRCSVWEEENLLVAGRERAGPLQADVRVVRRHVNNLIRAEECNGHHWIRLEHGNRRCQNCFYFMPLYHFKCNGCNHRVCYTCRFHRL